MASRRKNKNKNPLKRSFITVACILLSIGLFVAGARAVIYYIDDRMPAFRDDGVILVHENLTLRQLLADIDTVLLPKDTVSIRRVLTQELEGRTLCKGMYTFRKENSARYLARALTRGWQQPTMVVIDGRIRSKKELADKLSSYMMAGSEEFLRAMNDSIMLAKYGTTPSKLFSIIIPDTYQMYWSSTPQEVIARLKKEYDIYWNEERKAAAKKQGLSPYQVSVLASIVNEESNLRSDLPKIASVYLTRLRKGRKLEACPTVCYIYGYRINRVLYRHLRTDSPYNTYMYEGLPPTPICVPSKASLEAVLHPDSTPYMYFCADSSMDGSSRFAVTFAEHERNAALYRKAYEASQKAVRDSLKQRL